MSLKNKGRTLFYSQLGGVQPIPPEFVAAMQRKEEITSVPNEVTPEGLSDTVVESKVETDRTGERELRTIKKVAGPIVLRGVNTNEQGSPVQVVLTLIRTEDVGTVMPTAESTVAIKDLGNEFSIVEVATEGYYDEGGNFIPRVFGGEKWEREREDLTPKKFHHEVETATHRVDTAGAAVDPTLTGDELRESQEQITAGKKRVEVVTRDDPPLPVVLTGGFETSNEKQTVVVREVLQSKDTAPPIVTSLRDVTSEAIGDGRVHITTKDTPSVFSRKQFSVERPDVVPVKFRVAVPTTTSQLTIEGQALPPLLSTGDLQRGEEQINIFHKRVSQTSRANVPVPQSLISKKTSQKKQVVTVTETYRDGFVGEVVGDPQPTALKDVTIDNLGDGRVIETVEEVPSVFNAQLFGRQADDTVPPEFRTLYPNYTEENTTVGTTVSRAPLELDEITHEEQRITEHEKRVRAVKREILEYPQDLEQEIVDGLTSGGTKYDGEVKVTRRLHKEHQDVEAGFGNIFSRIENRGKINTPQGIRNITIKEQGVMVGVGDPPVFFPTLFEYQTDRETGAVNKRSKTIIPANTPPPDPDPVGMPNTKFIEDHAINSHHMERITETPDLTTYNTYYRVFPGNTNVDFPAVLKSVSAHSTYENQRGDFSEGGSFNLFSHGSGGLTLAGTAEASASVNMEVSLNIVEPRGVNIPCIHMLFLLAGAGGDDGVTHEQVRSRCELISTILNGEFRPVRPWPVWVPRAETFICESQQAKATARATASHHVTTRQNYNGDAIEPAQAISSGGGGSQGQGNSVKIVRVPPTIHKTLSPSLPQGDPGLLGDFRNRQSLAQAYAQIFTVGTAFPFSAGAIAYGNIYVGGQGEALQVPGTNGSQFIPTEDWYLYRVSCEPYLNGYVKVHAEVIDFAQVHQ